MGANRRTREREIVRWIGRMGALELGHLMRRWGFGRSVGYALVARLIEAGLLERVATLAGDPTLLRATQHGLAYAGLGVAQARVAPGQVDHWLGCGDAALWAEERWDPMAVLSERELRLAELEERKAIGSAAVGTLANGQPMLHRPDLFVADGEVRIPIEVELTPKAPRRLEHLLRCWRRTRDLSGVIYLVPPGAAKRAVLRARRNVHAEDGHIQVVDIGEVSPRAWEEG